MYEFTRETGRVPLFGVAEIRVCDHKNGLLIKALTQNVSASGIGLYVYAPIKVGARVSISIRFTKKDRKRPTDIITGTVAWTTEMDNYYCIGVTFDNPLNRRDQPNLYPHLMGQ